MSQNLSNDIWTQIEDYINQVWSSDGYLPSKLNAATHMKMHTYVFDLFLYISFSSLVICSLVYNYIFNHKEPGIHYSKDDNIARLYDHIDNFLQKKVHNTYQVSVCTDFFLLILDTL
jgi:hypothetical protein